MHTSSRYIRIDNNRDYSISIHQDMLEIDTKHSAYILSEGNMIQRGAVRKEDWKEGGRRKREEVEVVALTRDHSERDSVVANTVDAPDSGLCPCGQPTEKLHHPRD